jgi:hypothetical protein
MPPNVATRTDGPSSWFEALPPVTKLYMCLLVGATLGYSLQLLSPAAMALLWDRVVHKFEVRARPSPDPDSFPAPPPSPSRWYLVAMSARFQDQGV